MSKFLMYHATPSKESPAAPNREVGADLYDVSAEHFSEQISWLSKSGFQLSLNPEEEHGIILTFDDGEKSNFDVAFPILKQFGAKAYFFPIVKRIGTQGYMSWQDLRILKDEGMIIGSHGLTHTPLTQILPTQMREELRASKETLENNLNCTIETLSIPRGFYNESIIQTAQELGYKIIFISEKNTSCRFKGWGRIAIKKTWTLARLQLAIDGKTPVNEKILNALKRSLKLILRERGYNFLRSILLK